MSDTSAPSRRNRGLVIGAVVAILALALVAVLAITQMPQFAAADPTTELSPTASPSPTPVESPSASPSDPVTPSPSADSGELPTGRAAVMSFTRRCDAVPPVVAPATTVLDDGRVIWNGESGRLLVRQLTAESLDHFRDQVRSTGLFESPADYGLERRPGAPEPPGHGLCAYAFVWRDEAAEDVEVNSIMWLGDEEEALYYQAAPERKTLDALAQQLVDPTTWYGDDGWVQPEAVAFEPEEYLVLVSVTVPQLVTEGAPDFDEVSWPFDETPDEVGVEYGSSLPPSRCAVASAEDVEALAAEIAAAGVEGFDEPPFHGAGVGLPWSARNAAVDISFWPMLPDGRPECETTDDA